MLQIDVAMVIVFALVAFIVGMIFNGMLPRPLFLISSMSLKCRGVSDCLSKSLLIRLCTEGRSAWQNTSLQQQQRGIQLKLLTDNSPSLGRTRH